MKAILHSKRENFYYLEYCQVLVNGGRVDYGEFTRAKRGNGTDSANRFLDHGNYLACGLGVMATWVLGLPHVLAVLHGKTRGGALVFDAADLVKDAHSLPQVFISAMRGDNEQVYRHHCIESLTRSEALDLMIDTPSSALRWKRGGDGAMRRVV